MSKLLRYLKIGSVPNMIPVMTNISQDKGNDQRPLPDFPGSIIGIICWWGALSTPFPFYGNNVWLFFLYTWPCFLALLPIAIVTGMGIFLLLQGRIIFCGLVTAFAVTCLFWLLFFFLIIQ
ncbi:DUF3561 family protein [Enterobacteriaceae bacterium LUAb1]